MGSPEGLNPFGTTLAPDQQRVAPPQGHWNNPEAFAPTAPPTSGEQAPATPTPPHVAPSGTPAEPGSAAVGRDPALVPEGAPRILAGFLVSFDDNESGSFWPLYQGQNVIGRKDAMEGLDISIDHPTISSRHAILYASARPGRLEIEDPGSTNGTFLNDERLEQSQKLAIKDGDNLRFGGFSTVVKSV